MYVHTGSGVLLRVLPIAGATRRAPALRVAVRGDDALARAGLAARLSGIRGLDVVTMDAEVVVHDLGAIPLEGSHRLRTLDDIPVLVLAPDARTAEAALAAGAHGALSREPEAIALAAAVRAVAADVVVIDPAFAKQLFRRTSVDRPHEALTARERDVLALMAEGLSNRDIADRLGVQASTVKFHVQGILAKLTAESRTDAVVRAAQLGLIDL